MSRTYRKRMTWDDKEYYVEIIRKRDGKSHFKPDKAYKTMTKRLRRAKESQAMREGAEPPLFRHTDAWEWN